MSVSLTKEQLLERFKQRQAQFGDAVGECIKPEIPFTIKFI